MSRGVVTSNQVRITPQGTLTTFEGVADRSLLLFYGGPFSQWCQSPMTIDGVWYGCAEQYMMAQKARIFGDDHALKLIMDTDSPQRQKAIGRRVKDYSDERWHPFARDVVRTASLHKFKHPMFRWHLTQTGDAAIVEASPTDVVWGIGLAENDPLARRRSAWRGTNWLGQVLMEVRDLVRG